MADNQEKGIITLEENKRIQEYSEKLRALRENGTTKINNCRIELASVKKNKLIDEAERQRKIQSLTAEIARAKEVESKNKAEVASLSKEAVKYVNMVSKDIEKAVNEKQNKRMEGAKAYYAKEVAEIKQNSAARESDIRSRLSSGDPQMLKSELEICHYELKSALYDAKARYKDQLDKAKAIKHQAFVDHIQNFLSEFFRFCICILQGGSFHAIIEFHLRLCSGRTNTQPCIVGHIEIQNVGLWKPCRFHLFGLQIGDGVFLVITEGGYLVIANLCRRILSQGIHNLLDLCQPFDSLQRDGFDTVFVIAVTLIHVI